MTRDPAEFGWHCWSNTAHPPPSSTTYVASQMPSPLLPLPQGCPYKATPWQRQMPIRAASQSFVRTAGKYCWLSRLVYLVKIRTDNASSSCCHPRPIGMKENETWLAISTWILLPEYMEEATRKVEILRQRYRHLKTSCKTTRNLWTQHVFPANHMVATLA